MTIYEIIAALCGRLEKRPLTKMDGEQICSDKLFEAHLTQRCSRMPLAHALIFRGEFDILRRLSTKQLMKIMGLENEHGQTILQILTDEVVGGYVQSGYRKDQFCFLVEIGAISKVSIDKTSISSDMKEAIKEVIDECEQELGLKPTVVEHVTEWNITHHDTAWEPADELSADVLGAMSATC